MKWEAQKPDLALIKQARKVEERRKRVIGDGLPEYFLQEPEKIPELVGEPVVQEMVKGETAVIPIPRRQIGFRMEEPEPVKLKPAPLFQPNLEARKQAIETAKALKEELGRMPKKRELMAKGISDHYSRVALDELKNG